MNFKVNHNKASLNVMAVNFSSEVKSINFIKPLVEKIASPLVAELPSGEYSLYIRDIKEYSIDGKYPGGHTYNMFESMISLPDWSCDHSQIESVVAHELHHLVRWHYAGYGYSLGEAVISEGIATLYEEEISGIKPIWSKTTLDKSVADRLIREWNDKNYNHAEWFFNGRHGRWIGYSAGYKIAKEIYPDGINLIDSLKINIKPSDFDSTILIDK